MATKIKATVPKCKTCSVTFSPFTRKIECNHCLQYFCLQDTLKSDDKTRICKECQSEDAKMDITEPKEKKRTYKLAFKTPEAALKSKKKENTVEQDDDDDDDFTEEQLKKKLMIRLEADLVIVEDTSEFGRGGVYSILIVSHLFDELGKIGREKLIDSALKDVKKKIVISRQKSFTPSQWEIFGKKDPSCDTDACFKTNTVEQLSKMVFENEKTKFTQDGLKMTTEMLRLYVVEAASRASSQAKNEGCTVVELEHLEKILPQLLLDFV